MVETMSSQYNLGAINQSLKQVNVWGKRAVLLRTTRFSS